MIDIALLRTDPDLVRRTVKHRNADVDVDRLVKVDAELRQAIARSDNLRAQQKRQGKSREQVNIVELRREGDPVAADEARYHDTVGVALGILDLARG